MKTINLKFAVLASFLTFSSSLYAQSLFCNADARILAPSGDGQSTNIGGGTNGNSSNVDGNSDSNVNGAFGAEGRGTLNINDNLDRQSCVGEVTAVLTDSSNGAQVQMIRATMDDSKCTIQLQGRINFSQEQPVDANGNCRIENRGHQVTHAGQTFAISGFSFRTAQ